MNWLATILLTLGASFSGSTPDTIKDELAASNREWHERVSEGFYLMRTNRHDEAWSHLEWAWLRLLDPEFEHIGFDTDNTSLVTILRELSLKDKDRTDSIYALGDQLEERLRSGEGTMDDLKRWAAFRVIFRQQESLLDWFDRVRQAPNSEDSIRAVESRLVQAMTMSERWADLTLVYPDAASAVERIINNSALGCLFMALLQGIELRHGKTSFGSALNDTIDAWIFIKGEMRRQISLVYAGHLAAGNEVQAEAAAEALLRVDDSSFSRAQLLNAAKLADQPRERHRKWAAEIQDIQIPWIHGWLERSLLAENGDAVKPER